MNSESFLHLQGEEAAVEEAFAEFEDAAVLGSEKHAFMKMQLFWEVKSMLSCEMWTHKCKSCSCYSHDDSIEILLKFYLRCCSLCY
jgi:hypothetical protein